MKVCRAERSSSSRHDPLSAQQPDPFDVADVPADAWFAHRELASTIQETAYQSLLIIEAALHQRIAEICRASSPRRPRRNGARRLPGPSPKPRAAAKW